jgi:hypothetical protein
MSPPTEQQQRDARTHSTVCTSCRNNVTFEDQGSSLRGGIYRVGHNSKCTPCDCVHCVCEHCVYVDNCV